MAGVEDDLIRRRISLLALEYSETYDMAILTLDSRVWSWRGDDERDGDLKESLD